MILKDGRLLQTVQIKRSQDIVRARHAVAREMDELGTRTIRKTRFVTAVSEIARNALVHGGGGELKVYALRSPRRIGVRCSDNGPGIADLSRAFTDGVSSTGSMGKGLGGARRLCGEFEVESMPGQGTVVRMAGLL